MTSQEILKSKQLQKNALTKFAITRIVQNPEKIETGPPRGKSAITGKWFQCQMKRTEGTSSPNFLGKRKVDIKPGYLVTQLCVPATEPHVNLWKLYKKYG